MERKIYISHFKNFDYKLLHDPYFEVCNLQDKEVKTKFTDLIKDDVKESLSNKNLSELKILYRSWKLDNFSDMYGIFHYRRFLLMQHMNLLNIESSEFFWHGHFKVDWEHRVKIARRNIRKISELDGKLLVPRSRDVSDFNKKNIYDDFLGAHPELEEILNRTILVHQSITDDHEFKESIFNNQKMIHFNIFYGPGSFAKDLANYIFPTLEQLGLEYKNRFKGENIRWAGYIGERLFSHFVYKTIRENKVEVSHVPVIYFDSLRRNLLEGLASRIKAHF
jgi:hypothetical protein